ncbi:MAG: alpha/beta fold hydrolase [Alphaproteobacteria bacterium]|nr:alpha/beta fold hydrolase [Alphaproteobacteria bacterium]MBM3629916.1 alpha/beta fold hydrolase [Alphaproteobacteria bacterium]
MVASRRRRWERQARDWPHRDSSRFVAAGGIEWRVQTMGAGPWALLLHGTGASTHSFRDLAPALARDFSVLAVDLPGHGFTGTPASRLMSLRGFAGLVSALCDELHVSPALAAGHSAGAAVLIRMALDGKIAPRGIAALNGALLPLNAPGAMFFKPIARLLAGLPILPALLAYRSESSGRVERLLAGTGSRLDAAGIRFYRQLLADPDHVGAALAMMASWDIETLAGELPRLTVPLALVIGSNDRTISPDEQRRVAQRVPDATIDMQPGLGHLAHEEDPEGTAEILRARFASWVQRTA